MYCFDSLKEISERECVVEKSKVTLYEVYDDGVEICWGFECKCEFKGDCNNCELMKSYNEACKANERS